MRIGLTGVLVRTTICSGSLGGIIAVSTRNAWWFIVPVITGLAIATLVYTRFLPIVAAILFGSMCGVGFSEENDEYSKTAVLVGAVAGVIFVYCLSFAEPKLWPTAFSKL